MRHSFASPQLRVGEQQPMPQPDPPFIPPDADDPLAIANELFADVADNPFDSTDRERLRLMVALAMLSTANDVRRIADAGSNPGPHEA
jgi:hypothetical protein